jgi:hypothetical protein
MLAKNNMRRHVALINAFPERDHHLCEAENVLIKTITDYKEEHVLHQENPKLLIRRDQLVYAGICKNMSRSVSLSWLSWLSQISQVPRKFMINSL